MTNKLIDLKQFQMYFLLLKFEQLLLRQYKSFISEFSKVIFKTKISYNRINKTYTAVTLKMFIN